MYLFSLYSLKNKNAQQTPEITHTAPALYINARILLCLHDPRHENWVSAPRLLGGWQRAHQHMQLGPCHPACGGSSVESCLTRLPLSSGQGLNCDHWK